MKHAPARMKLRPGSKRQRRQPRALTPPVKLRCESDDQMRLTIDEPQATHAIVQVDEELETGADRWTSTLTKGYVKLGPGLKLKVKSRCINKWRFPVLEISRE
jgi:hypothetical protein